MHRFFLPPERCQDRILTLRGTEAHHASRVLRLRPRELAVVLDGAGKSYQCEVLSSAKSTVVLEVHSVKTSPPPPGCIRLVAGIPKGQLFDEIVEQASELGVSQIVPVMTERGNVRLDETEAVAKQAKWQMIAREAMKQSGNLWTPSIHLPLGFRSLLLMDLPADLALVASLQPGACEVRDVFSQHRERVGSAAKRVTIWIGPEGDFTSEELEQLSALGVRPITLGPWTLRCPTAALASLAIVAHELRLRL